MTDPNFSAIRARLRYQSIDEFIEGYGRYISRGGMFVPMSAQKLKPVGTTVRFQFLLADGSSAMLGEGVVRQLKGLENDSGDGPVGMLVKFTKLSQESKALVDQILVHKSGVQPIPKAPETPTPTSTPIPQPPEDIESAPEAEERDNTGVLGADAANSLRNESGSAGIDETDGNTAELALDPPTRELLGLDADELTGEAELAEAGEESPTTSGDEIFGSEEDEETAQAVAGALSSEPSWGESDSESDEQSDLPSEEDDSDPFGGIFDEAVDAWSHAEEQEEQAHQSVESEDAPNTEALEEEDIVDAVAAPSTEALDDEDVIEEEVAPSTEALEEEDIVEEVADEGPKAIKETKAGIRVMSFDGEEIDESATREFEEFASGGEEEEIDQMFDNIFGGDGGGGLFGDGDDGGGDFFEEVEEISPQVDEELQLALQEDGGEDEVESAFEGLSDAEEEEEEEEEEPLAWDLGEDPAGEEALPEASEPIVASNWDTGEDEEEKKEGSVNSSENILSLLEMEDEDEEMTLNLGGGGLSQESSTGDEEEEDSIESLLALAKKDIESKEDSEEVDEERDILDDLLGDDDLPPPATGGSPFQVPKVGEKKKGFMSKFFKKD